MNTTAPHDALFKKFLTDPTVARDFMEIHLPPHIRERCDLSTLHFENTSFIEEHLKQQSADVLYRLNIAGSQAYIYVLVEAQSTAEKLMAFRMLKYQMSIMKRHLDEGHKTLPVIVPILFYSGQTKPYPYSVNLMDCFDDPDLARTIMFGDFKLIDLSVLTLEEIKTHKHIALLEGIMQQVYMRDAINLAHYLIALEHSAQVLHSQWQDVLEYVLSVRKQGYFEGFFETFKEISKEQKESVMTLEEFFMEKGVLRGMEKGREEGKHTEAMKIARKMANEGATIDFIKKVTELNDQDLQLLRRSH